VAILAACVKERGFAVDLIDLRALHSWDHYLEQVRARRPDVVGVGIMSVDYAWLQWALAESQRRTLPNRMKRASRKWSQRLARPGRIVRRLRQVTSPGG
jgi:hypothetical protein